MMGPLNDGSSTWCTSSLTPAPPSPLVPLYLTRTLEFSSGHYKRQWCSTESHYRIDDWIAWHCRSSCLLLYLLVLFPCYFSIARFVVFFCPLSADSCAGVSRVCVFFFPLMSAAPGQSVRSCVGLLILRMWLVHWRCHYNRHYHSEKAATTDAVCLCYAT